MVLNLIPCTCCKPHSKPKQPEIDEHPGLETLFWEPPKEIPVDMPEQLSLEELLGFTEPYSLAEALQELEEAELAEAARVWDGQKGEIQTTNQDDSRMTSPTSDLMTESTESDCDQAAKSEMEKDTSMNQSPEMDHVSPPAKNEMEKDTPMNQSPEMDNASPTAKDETEEDGKENEMFESEMLQSAVEGIPRLVIRRVGTKRKFDSNTSTDSSENEGSRNMYDHIKKRRRSCVLNNATIQYTNAVIDSLDKKKRPVSNKKKASRGNRAE